jgi:hypothetical protein
MKNRKKLVLALALGAGVIGSSVFQAKEASASCGFWATLFGSCTGPAAPPAPNPALPGDWTGPSSYSVSTPNGGMSQISQTAFPTNAPASVTNISMNASFNKGGYFYVAKNPVGKPGGRP